MQILIGILLFAIAAWPWVQLALSLFRRKPTQAELSQKALNRKPPKHFNQRVRYKLRKGRVSSVTNTGMVKK